jgi:SAM-dependent methyltransferase
MKNYYDNLYHQKVHSRYFANDTYYWARAEAAAKLNFSGIDTNQLRILEYGCGYGQNIACLPDAWGYDISDLARTECLKRGLKIFSNPQEIPANSFDIVLSRHCLEHVENPLENLIWLKKYIKPGGVLILILPKERHKRVNYEPDVHQHLYCWNFRSINNLLNRAGYEIVLNKYQGVVGYNTLLPIRRLFGKAAYYRATLLAGRLFGVIELVVRAKKRDGN